jgi:hypothetical protein
MKRVALLALILCWCAAPAAATPQAQPAGHVTSEDFSAQRRMRPIATRLEVFPSSRQVRRCVDWYAIEYRPSGKVLTPQMRCWWAKR